MVHSRCRIILLWGIVFLFASLNNALWGQDSVWSLTRCIDYAREHNLDLQKATINTRLAKMNWEESRLQQLPSISTFGNLGRSFGRSINPTSNEFESTTYDYFGINGSASVLLFGWLGQRNTIKRNDFLQQAAQADWGQLQDDITLNVVNAYLRVLLAKEQVEISENQWQLSLQQRIVTKALLEAGRSNGLDFSQMRTQSLIDSSNILKAKWAYRQTVLDLKTILNLPFETHFVPDSILGKENMATAMLELSAENIYQEALINRNDLISHHLKIKGMIKDIAIAKSRLFPSLSLSTSSGSNYSSTFFDFLPNGERVLMPWGRQLQNNFSQSLSLSLSIPIFNSLSNQYAVKRARNNLIVSRLDLEQKEKQLEQTIYKAWNDMHSALETWRSATATTQSAQKAYYFAQQRYAKGLINATDYLTAQTTLSNVRFEEAITRFDFIFKVKILTYYWGKKS